MNEYNEHIEYFKDYWWSSFTNLISETEWGNKELARVYFEKYWLPQKEYESKWKYIQERIFINQDQGLPELVFSNHYSLLPFVGGCLFLEEDFNQFQKVMLEIGEKYFIIIENTFGGKLNEPAFRFKFPIEITWKELMSGNYISSIVFEMQKNEYFVFGENDSWGKYSASDYLFPIDIFGFKSELYPIFNKNYKLNKEELKEISEELPIKYKSLIKWNEV